MRPKTKAFPPRPSALTHNSTATRSTATGAAKRTHTKPFPDKGRPPHIILFNKPFGVQSQFSGAEPERTLSAYIRQPGFYPAGRLDADSEGLMVLTDDGALQHQMTDPRYKRTKTYLVQVEGLPSADKLDILRAGVDLGDFRTQPCHVESVDEPMWLWPRNPPIRFRKNIPTAWLKLSITEGKNRQVRRMTAKVGLPTLRLVRIAVGPWQLDDLLPGQWRLIKFTPQLSTHR